MVSLNTLKAVTEASIKNIEDVAVHSKKVTKTIEKVASECTEKSAAKAMDEVVVDTKSNGKVREIISNITQEAKESTTISSAVDVAKAIKEKGIKEAIPNIKDGVKNIIGMNDVVAAKEAEGTASAIKEGAKLGVKGLFTLVGGVAGFLIPVPGAQIVGMVLGEKLGAKLVGKRFTKKIAEQLSKEGANLEELAQEAAKVGENLDKTV